MSDAAAFRIVARKLIVTAAIVGVTVVVTLHMYNKQLKKLAAETHSRTSYNR